jgi:hypothetical protein
MVRFTGFLRGFLRAGSHDSQRSFLYGTPEREFNGIVKVAGSAKKNRIGSADQCLTLRGARRKMWCCSNTPVKITAYTEENQGRKRKELNSAGGHSDTRNEDEPISKIL